MADNLLDARVLARRQKDVDGYTKKYQDIVDARIAKHGQEIAPIWARTARRIELQLKQLVLQIAAGKDVLPDYKLNALANQATRLNTLYGEIRTILRENEAPLNKKLGNKMAYTYSEAYYFNAFGLEKDARLGIQVPLLSYNQVMRVLANPWLPDGKTYSDRIRANTAYLAAKMKDSIGRAVTEGWAWNKTALHIKKTAQEGYFNSVRLARTELNRAANQGASQLYMENADILDGKRWNATLDRRTAPKDASNDGKTYPLEYDTSSMAGVPGERIPNHPNCRCKYSPVLSALGISNRERIARKNDGPNSFGERYYTKAGTYREYAKERGLPDLDERLANDDPTRYLRQNERVPKGPRPKNLLPNLENAVLPKEKFLDYCLNKEHPQGRDKAVAFDKILGYNKDNYQELIAELKNNLGQYKALKKGVNKYGIRYQVIMPIKGPNGNTASVLTGWIVSFGEENPVLTSVYITKKKV